MTRYNQTLLHGINDFWYLVPDELAEAFLRDVQLVVYADRNESWSGNPDILSDEEFLSIWAPFFVDL